MKHKFELDPSETALVVLSLRLTEAEQTLRASEAFHQERLSAVNPLVRCSERCGALAKKFEKAMNLKLVLPQEKQDGQTIFDVWTQ